MVQVKSPNISSLQDISFKVEVSDKLNFGSMCSPQSSPQSEQGNVVIKLPVSTITDYF